MDQPKKPDQQQITIELPPEKADGTYANLVAIAHSPAEFVVDFIRMLPGVPKARVQSRIIMTPQHTKSFLLALKDNIDRYEAQHGEIKLPPQGNMGKAFGFQTGGIGEKN